MFGEEFIIGRTYVKVENKGRITIPKFTKVEVGEELALLSNINENYLELCKYDSFINNLNKFDRGSNEYNVYLSTFISKVTVDKDKRVLIPQSIRNIFEITEQVCLEGDNDTLRIFSSHESFKENVRKKVLKLGSDIDVRI